MLFPYHVLGLFYLSFLLNQPRANSISEIVDWSSLFCNFVLQEKRANRHACRSCFYRTPCICHCLVVEPRFIVAIVAICPSRLKTGERSVKEILFVSLRETCDKIARIKTNNTYKITESYVRWKLRNRRGVSARNIFVSTILLRLISEAVTVNESFRRIIKESND